MMKWDHLFRQQNSTVTFAYFCQSLIQTHKYYLLKLCTHSGAWCLLFGSGGSLQLLSAVLKHTDPTMTPAGL